MNGYEFIRKIIADGKGDKYRNSSQLAAMAGISPGNLSRFLKKERGGISFDTGWRIMRALDVQPSLSGRGGETVPLYRVDNSDADDPKLKISELITLPRHFNVECCVLLDEDVPGLSLTKGTVFGLTPFSRFIPDHLCLAKLPRYGYVFSRVSCGGRDVTFRPGGSDDGVVTPVEAAPSVIRGTVSLVMARV